ncbi:MAG: nucleotidyltransferase [bacterium]|jgi:predicted nucleotidyltransferase|nr:nucleotidyltransferase [candidate division KSB1 bacterium]MDH7560652.1 nucleotidyltransferase [bacterium]
MDVLQAAVEVARFLEDRGIPYFLIGGLALQHWGEPRLTRDVDITVLMSPEKLDAFVDAVLSQFAPRISDAREFALQHRVLLVQTGQRLPIDISLGIPGYEEEALQRAAEVDFPGVGKLRLIGPEDLIIHKCVAGRARDGEDVEGILIRQRLKLDLDLIRSWLGGFREVVDTHDPLELFENAVERARRALEEAGNKP